MSNKFVKMINKFWSFIADHFINCGTLHTHIRYYIFDDIIQAQMACDHNQATLINVSTLRPMNNIYPMLNYRN